MIMTDGLHRLQYHHNFLGNKFNGVNTQDILLVS